MKFFSWLRHAIKDQEQKIDGVSFDDFEEQREIIHEIKGNSRYLDAWADILEGVVKEMREHNGRN